MTAFIETPWLALVPAGAFLACYRFSRHRFAGAAAALWAGYAFYEYAMQRRWLCTGECNIRVDLLLLYPVLFVTSLVALFAAASTIMRRQGGRPGTPKM